MGPLGDDAALGKLSKKAPFSWPKSSEAINDGGIAAQFTAINARDARLERLWSARD
jgi:hypothetical protein